MKTILLFLLLPFLAEAQTGAPICDVTRGLVLNWPFDAGRIHGTSAEDISGNGNVGTLENSPSPVPGKIGQALLFNQGSTSDQYVHLGDSIVGTNTVTVSAWINLTGWGGNGHGYIVGTADPNDMMYPEFIIFCSSSFNTSTDTVFLNSDAQNGGSDSLAAPSGTISLNTWEFICCIRNSNGSGIIYVNGVQVASGATGAVGPDTYFDVGNRSLDLARCLQGTIDDVRVYNRALSAQEIQRLFKWGGGTNHLENP
jgi:hypothetical protein